MITNAVFLVVAISLGLPAAAQTPPDPNAPQAAIETPASTPAYTVGVERSGRVLHIRIIPQSRQQANLLFGKEKRQNPTIQIYKGDQLLNSGRFAFG